MNFLKWLTITTVYLVIFIGVEYNYAYFYNLFEGDSTIICEVIAAVFLTGMGLCLFYSLEENPKFKKIERLADICTMLGLLGSVIGFAITLAGAFSGGTDLEGSELAKNILTSIAAGIPTALNTTILGIYAALALIAYPFFIRRRGENNG